LTLTGLTAVGLATGAPAQLEPRRSESASGAITGTISLSAAIASRKMRFRLYSDLGPGAVPQRDAADQNEMVNVVVYLESAASLGDAPAAARPVVVSQQKETFRPHVIPVTRGTSVDFRNDDPYFHNIFSLSKAKTFDLGRYPQGESKVIRFDRTGVVQVFCHIHADMSAIVIVLDHPHFVTPAAGGEYRLEGVPPGEYRIVAWHERAKPVIRPVTVTAGETTSLDLSIPIPPAAPPRA
jgi:plastocyanin